MLILAKSNKKKKKDDDKRKKERADFAKAILEYNTRHESKESDTTEIQKANRKINKIEEKRLRKAAKRIWA